ncbi:MAG: hypothetical protein KBG42_03895 [Lachnospiraceae bacterium]|nr:hypothetical protein [Lachnospiraceae bacterium]
MVQSNALTVPFFVALASTSLCLSQPIIQNNKVSSVLEEDVYRTTTLGQYSVLFSNPSYSKSFREQALELFGEQSDLTVAERKARNDSLRKISKSVGLNVFDMYKMRNTI